MSRYKRIARSARRGAAFGALGGLALGSILFATWWFGRNESQQAYSEGLEGAVLLAAILGQPFSYLLLWVADIGSFPLAWIQFVLIVPALNWAMVGLILGATYEALRRQEARDGPDAPAT